jgi:hypothetical protein
MNLSGAGGGGKEELIGVVIIDWFPACYRIIGARAGRMQEKL